MHGCRARPTAAQRGVALFVVLILVLLTTLLVVWASRSALFNEMITGTDSDYQRAFEAAQAMVRDAELDLQGKRSDGTPCGSEPAGTAFANCRPAGKKRAEMDVANKKVYFPPPGDGLGVDSEFAYLQSQLKNMSPSCVAGVCIASGTTSPTATQFWSDESLWAKMKSSAATFGLYTGATSDDAGGNDNPLLKTKLPSDIKAWYWIEPLRYQGNGSDASQMFAPVGGSVEAAPVGVVYRITAVAQGLKPQTMAVIQTVFVRREYPG